MNDEKEELIDRCESCHAIDTLYETDTGHMFCGACYDDDEVSHEIDAEEDPECGECTE